MSDRARSGRRPTPALSLRKPHDLEEREHPLCQLPRKFPFHFRASLTGWRALGEMCAGGGMGDLQGRGVTHVPFT